MKINIKGLDKILIINIYLDNYILIVILKSKETSIIKIIIYYK
jgi:hypothetical protein